jgi:hypothetical protein
MKCVLVKPKSNFTVVTNSVLKDDALSFKAIGLYTYLVGLHPDIHPSINYLAAKHKDGKASIESAVNELVDAGWLKIEQPRDGGKFGCYVWVLSGQKGVFSNDSPKPDFPDTEKPDTENPDTRKPDTENQGTYKTSLNKTKRDKDSINKTKKTPLPPKGDVSKKLHHTGLPLDALWKESFEDFWDIYPKKRGKETAKNSWYKLKGDEHLYCDICNAVIAWSQTEDWLKNDGQFVPNASTFLNQKRWQDEIPAAKPIDRTDPKWMAENDDYTAIGGTKGATDEEYDALAAIYGWYDKDRTDE